LYIDIENRSLHLCDENHDAIRLISAVCPVSRMAFYGSEKTPPLRALVGATLAVGGVIVLGICNGKNKQ
jgi:hypothetical protein